MKRIGLVIAAAMLGTTGIASAGMAAHQFTVAHDSQSTALDAKTDIWQPHLARKLSGRRRLFDLQHQHFELWFISKRQRRPHPEQPREQNAA